MSNKYIITKGTGSSNYELNAFDNALLSSGIADYNLVKLSSILPAQCTQVDYVDLPKGDFLHTAYSSYIENQPNKIISAAVAIAKPEDSSFPGVIMEVAGEFDSFTAKKLVIDMACVAMEARKIDKFNIQEEVISMRTKDCYNCVIAAVSIW